VPLAALLFLERVGVAASQNNTTSTTAPSAAPAMQWPCPQAGTITMLSDTKRLSNQNIEEICSVVHYGSQVNLWCAKTSCYEYSLDKTKALKPAGDSCATADVNIRDKTIAWKGRNSGFYSEEMYTKQKTPGKLEGVYEVTISQGASSDTEYWSIHHRDDLVWIFTLDKGVRKYELVKQGNADVLVYLDGDVAGSGQVLETGDINFGKFKLRRWDSCTTLPKLPGWPKCGCHSGDSDGNTDLVAGAPRQAATAGSLALATGLGLASTAALVR